MMSKKKVIKNPFVLAPYFKKYWGAILLYFFLYLIKIVVNVALTISLANVLTYITEADYEKSILYLLISIILLIVILLNGLLLNTVYKIYSLKIIKEIRLNCVRQAFKLSSATYADHKTGEFTQRIVNDTSRTIEQLDGFIGYIGSIISAIIVLVYIAVLSWFVALIILGIIIIGSIIDVFRLKFIKRNRRKTMKLNDSIYSIVNEIVKSEKDIKTSGLENKLSKIVDERQEEYIKQNKKTSFGNYGFNFARNIFLQVGIYGTFLLGIILMQRELLTVSVFMIIFSNSSALLSLPYYISYLSELVVEVKLSINRIKQLFDDNEYVVEKFGNVHLDKVDGNIKFKNVCFNYKAYDYKEDKKTGLSDKVLKSENQVLKDLSFEIKPNTTVAFVGRSGSGKSTIVSLIAKILETDEGEVLIDDVNIKDLDKETLRKTISLVNQFPYIFDMSIKENLLLAKKDATDEEIRQVLKDSFLEEFINSLPDGIETVVGESGIKLSGGQRQRLAIARALLRKSSIIIFDESTSSLDNFAQEHIKHCIDGLKGKSTIVIVAHRLSTIKNVDKIYFLENGKIIDTGTFNKLYKTNNTFKNMFSLENLKDSIGDES